jgi:hypothetical protein
VVSSAGPGRLRGIFLSRTGIAFTVAGVLLVGSVVALAL